jgi:hypothetical protein
MKKILIITLIGFSLSSYSTEKNRIKLKKTSSVEINCDKVYTQTRDAALAQGFTIGSAQQIGAAAYYSCKNSNRKAVTAE